jgi:general secretion pathway protein B
MSYILEALRKAERERTLGKVPNLESIHITPSLSPQRRWPWLLALVALVNAIALTVFYFSSLQDRATVSWRNLDARHSPIPPPTPTTHPSTAVEPVSPIVGRTASSAAGMLDFDTSSESTVAEEKFVYLESAKLARTPDRRLDAARSSRSASPVEMAAEQESWPPPVLRALPMAFRSSLPPINVDVHVYSDDPDKRFVLINSRHYREGDQLVEGPLLETIDPQGTVLQFQGQRFTIPVSR